MRFIWVGLTVLLASCSPTAPTTEASASEVAPPPGGTAGATATASAATGGRGTIEGRVSYPAGSRPTLEVYAIDVNDDSRWFAVEVPGTETPGHDPQGHYSLDVDPGTYHVIAYPVGEGDQFAGLYSEMVPCGLSVGCTDHTLIPVTVAAGETVTGVDPGDFYYASDQDIPDRPR
jgi:hypothetical protein